MRQHVLDGHSIHGRTMSSETFEHPTVPNSSLSVSVFTSSIIFLVFCLCLYPSGGDLFTKVADRVAAASEELERKKQEYLRAGVYSEDMQFMVEPERFTEDEILHFVNQICEGLLEIHQMRLIHRDIKVLVALRIFSFCAFEVPSVLGSMLRVVFAVEHERFTRDETSSFI